jgi:hypothetical protein
MRHPSAQETLGTNLARNANRRALGRLPSLIRLAGSANLLASVASPSELPAQTFVGDTLQPQTDSGEIKFRLGYSQIGGGHKVV